jgi:16S rRNA (uracil1498-N3)-methyltransferase
MRLQRFFINQKIELGEMSVSDAGVVHQIKNVFRMKGGEEIVIFDGSGFEFKARVSEVSKNSLTLNILEKIENKVFPKNKITLCQSLIKKDNFEWIVEKGTELGVSEFLPIVSERSEKKNLNIERLNIIAKEATEQSGRAIVPKILNPQALNDVLNTIDTKTAIVFDSSGSSFSSSKSLFLIHDSLFFFIGPEGGWTEKELELFKSKNIPIYSLGNMTLRAETGAIAVTSLFLLS